MKRTFQQTLLAAVLALAIGVAQAMSLAEAVEKVRRETGGKILSATTEVRGDREVHVVKVLTPEGRVRTIRVKGDRVRKDRPDAYFID